MTTLCSQNNIIDTLVIIVDVFPFKWKSLLSVVLVPISENAFQNCSFYATPTYQMAQTKSDCLIASQCHSEHHERKLDTHRICMVSEWQDVYS